MIPTADQAASQPAAEATRPLAALDVPKRFIKAALVTAAKMDIRFYLCGLHFDVSGGKAFLVSTDGQRMTVLAFDADGVSDQRFVVGRPAIDRLLLSGKIPTIKFTFDPATNVVEMDGDGFVIRTKALELPRDGYPNWRKVVPRSISGAAANFNPLYVGGLSAISSALGIRDRYQQPSIHHNGVNAALVTYDREPAYLGILMPLRQEIAADALPKNKIFSSLPVETPVAAEAVPA